MGERDLEYEKNERAYDRDNADYGIKCKNYIVCKCVLPVWWWECKGCYICTNCDMMFGNWKSGNYVNTGKGILDRKGVQECPVCLESKECISQPRCDHYVCFDCFKSCFYKKEIKEPDFPYPEIEDEYFDDEDNDKWKDYPLIKKYNDEYNELLDEEDERYEKNGNLRLCPLCRK
jgi:hypothetical protein